MNIKNRRELKTAAAAALQASRPDFRNLVFFHTAITLGLSLLLMLADWALQQGVSGTGGLDGMGARSFLSSIQVILRTAVDFAMPFWNAGLVWASVCVARQEEAGFSSLMQGFRCFGPILRLMLVWAGIGMLLMFFCINVAVFVITVPAFGSAGFLNEEMLTDPAMLEQVLQQFVTPAVILIFILFLTGLLLLSYRFRFAIYEILDTYGMGALAAMGRSNAQTRGHKMDLFRLDLSFWWYYGLQAVLVFVGSADVLLPLMGVALPVDPTTAYWLCYGVFLLGTLAMSRYADPYVQTVYATTYQTLGEQ